MYVFALKWHLKQRVSTRPERFMNDKSLILLVIVWSKIELQTACVKLIHMRLKAIYIFYVRD